MHLSVVPEGTERRCWVPFPLELKVTGGCEPSNMGAEISGPLQEQSVLSVTEPSLAPQKKKNEENQCPS